MSRGNLEPDDDKEPIERTRPADPPSGGHPLMPADFVQIPGITIVHEIARGGMGVVYSARQDFLDRRVAVKLLSRDLAGEKFAARFRREAKILAGIKHAHIVACHSAGTTDDGQSYLVMEFVDGPNLKSWIQDHGPVPIAAALRLTRALAQALAHALTLNVIHRDVKAENILLENITSTAIDVSFPFTPKLVDLGLARMTSEVVGLGLTSPGAVMGTPSTMSPEQFDDPDSVDYRTDIYGLGCVLYEMLVGAPAFRSAKMTELIARKRRPLGPNPCDENPAVPLEVGRFVTTMLASDRDMRPRNYKDLDERLGELLAKATGAPPPAKTELPPKTRPPTEVTRLSDQKAMDALIEPPAAESSGPGLLKTAELDFLSKGFPTGDDKFGPTVPAAFAPAPSAPVTEVSDRRGLVVGVLLAVVALGGGGVWFGTRGGGAARTKERPPGNSAPTAEIDGPSNAILRKPMTLTANATDPDNDPLVFTWKSPREVSLRGESQQAVEITALDGLPGESFLLSCEISDGYGSPLIVTKEVRLDEVGFDKRQMLLGCTERSSQWLYEPANEGMFWAEIRDPAGNYLSCRKSDASGALRQATFPLSDEAFWRIDGRLESAKGKNESDPNDPVAFAEVIVRIEAGTEGWSLHCRRDGEDGAEWSVKLVSSQLTHGAWQAGRVELQPTVTWTQGEEAEEPAFADISISRRRDKLVFRYGRFDEAKVEEYEVSLPGNVPPLKVALAVDGGLGRFRSFTLW